MFPRTNNCLGTRSAGRRVFARSHFARLGAISLVFAISIAASGQNAVPANTPSGPGAALPNAPPPKTVIRQKSKIGPCRVVTIAESAGSAITTLTGALEFSVANPDAQSPPPPNPAALPPCPPTPIIDWFARFINGPEVKPLTPKEKARLAVKNLVDPFNAVTILGQSAIAVGSDAHSPYGPGLKGFGKNVGVSYTEDMTGEFFGTFLIPTVFHQDPHYHRMPHASIPRRFGHAIFQVVWTQGDNGHGMLNYANLLGFPIEAQISNLYVPGEQTDAKSTAWRYAIGMGIAPTDNFITEFLPDLARRVHVRIVLVQRIIDQVAKTEPAGSP
ncbi:MAG TPA: hypothetical protein VKR52_15240 [Terracidiphilus sp.]|nr:hypothetical protein [Terracidiphilus sp.]